MKVSYGYLDRKAMDAGAVLERIGEVASSGKFTLGDEVERFEGEFASFIGVKHAVAVASGTDALFLALKAKGVGPGHSVVTSPYTFVATVGAIVACGARPIFADVGADLNLDPERAYDAVEDDTRAIIPVHWAGVPADVERIRSYCGERGIALIEDAAQAVGARLRGKNAGAMGDIGCFSLHPLKNLHVWGDGGVMTTDDEPTARRLRLLRNHGLADRDTVTEFGFNSRLDAVQAAVARHYMAELKNVCKSRFVNGTYYDQQLHDVPGVIVPRRPSQSFPVFHLYQILVESRADLAKHLSQRGVETKVHYPVPVHLQPAYLALNLGPVEMPNAEAAAMMALSLPVHEYMTTEEQKHVCDSIKEFYG